MSLGFIKLAAELEGMGLDNADFEDYSQIATPAAGLAGLGGLSAYGAVRAKRDAEKAIMDSLAANIRASELANQISDNARARELLAGKGGEATFGEHVKRGLNPNKITRDLKASGSSALQKILKALQAKKIL